MNAGAYDGEMKDVVLKPHAWTIASVVRLCLKSCNLIIEQAKCKKIIL